MPSPIETGFKKATQFYADNKDNVNPSVATVRVAHTVYQHGKTLKKIAAAGQSEAGAVAESGSGTQAVVDTVETAASKGGTGFIANAKSFIGKNGKTFGKVGLAYSVGSIFWDVAKEPGHFLDKGPDGGVRVGHKGERLIASTATAAPTIALSTFQLATAGTAATAETATAAGGTAAAVGGTATLATLGTAVAVIAVPAAATWAIKRDADAVIETRRLYEQADKAFQPGTHTLRHQSAGPQAASYNNLLPAARLVSKYMLDANLSHPVARNKDGSIKNINDLDLSDGRNRRELRRALNQAIEDEQKIADNNGSLVPRWLRHGSGVEAEQAALIDKRQLESAETELGQYAAAVNDYKRTQKSPSAPAPGR